MPLESTEGLAYSTSPPVLWTTSTWRKTTAVSEQSYGLTFLEDCLWNTYEVCPVSLGQMTVSKLDTTDPYLWTMGVCWYHYMRIQGPSPLKSAPGEQPFGIVSLQPPKQKAACRALQLKDWAHLFCPFNCAQCKCQEGAATIAHWSILGDGRGRRSRCGLTCCWTEWERIEFQRWLFFRPEVLHSSTSTAYSSQPAGVEARGLEKVPLFFMPMSQKEFVIFPPDKCHLFFLILSSS